jgi:hypothetical protein
LSEGPRASQKKKKRQVYGGPTSKKPNKITKIWTSVWRAHEQPAKKTTKKKTKIWTSLWRAHEQPAKKIKNLDKSVEGPRASQKLKKKNKKK